MFGKMLKTVAFIFMTMCLVLSNNVAHAGGGQSSAGGTSQGGGGATRSF